MTLTEGGKSLIRQFEGLRLNAYRDIVGVLTVGYGHTGSDVYEGLTIDPRTANELLDRDLDHFVVGVERLLNIVISDNAFSALVAFAYNLGLGSLKSSTLLKLVNEGKMDEAALQFERWSKAGGKVVPGLLRRRQAEKALFLS